MTKKPKQFTAIYERVSSKSQKHDSQDLPLKRWCRSHGIKCNQYRMYKDKASGKNNKRPELQRLLKHVEDGKVKMVVVFSLSRLSRSLLSGVKIIGTLLEHDVRIVSLSENIDLSGSTGRFIAHFMLCLYQWQRESQNDFIKLGIQSRRAKGLQIGRPRDTKRLARILKMRNSGLSAIEIANSLGTTRSNVYGLLKRAG